MEYICLLESVLRDEEAIPQLKVHAVEETPCAPPGQNFMSVVSLVRVEGILPNGGLYSKSLFIKRPPADHRLPFSVDDAFSNEVLMYLSVVPLITHSPDVIELPFARCYYASSDVIVLEDLKTKGYRVGNIAEGFELYTAENALKALAKFHAASFHAIAVNGDKFTEVTNGLKPLGIAVSSNKSMLENCLTRTIRYVSEQKDLETAVTSLRNLEGRVIETMIELRKPEKIGVLCHGDFSYNNILTCGDYGNRRVSKSSVIVGKGRQIRIVDLQACALMSPAVDFWLFLYTCVSPTILENSLDSFIQHYSSTFFQVLSYLKTPVENIPSSTSLKDELLSKELYGFLSLMVYLPSLYLNPEMILEIVQASEEQRKEDGFLDRFLCSESKERLATVVRYCKRKGLL